jgi:hypothetical protein
VTNQELTDAYRRVTEQFKDLQLKARARQKTAGNALERPNVTMLFR